MVKVEDSRAGTPGSNPPPDITGSPSSLVTVNMTLRNGVIIRVCMVNTSILRNNKMELPFLAVCITSVSMAFGGVLERF